jgi:hypothetical protein
VISVNSAPVTGDGVFYGVVYATVNYGAQEFCYALGMGYDNTAVNVMANDGTNKVRARWLSADYTRPGPRVLVGTITTSELATWENGVKVATDVGTASIAYGAESSLSVFVQPLRNRSLNSTFNAGAIWNRALSDAEIIRLSADPFVFLK